MAFNTHICMANIYMYTYIYMHTCIYLYIHIYSCILMYVPVQDPSLHFLMDIMMTHWADDAPAPGGNPALPEAPNPPQQDPDDQQQAPPPHPNLPQQVADDPPQVSPVQQDLHPEGPEISQQEIEEAGPPEDVEDLDAIYLDPSEVVALDGPASLEAQTAAGEEPEAARKADLGDLDKDLEEYLRQVVDEPSPQEPPAEVQEAQLPPPESHEALARPLVTEFDAVADSGGEPQVIESLPMPSTSEPVAENPQPVEDVGVKPQPVEDADVKPQLFEDVGVKPQPKQQPAAASNKTFTPEPPSRTTNANQKAELMKRFLLLKTLACHYYFN